MMKVHIVAPDRRYRIIVQGPLAAAVDAAGAREDRPLRNVHINGYGAVHATLITCEDTLREWFSACHDIHAPGTLLFWLLHTEK